MSYFRRPMGDGPITDPSQVDPSITLTVPPNRVDCAALPSDSPWRGPGQVCAPTGIVQAALDLVRGAVAEPVSVTTTNMDTGASSGFEIPGVVVVGALAALGYYMFRKKKRS